MRPRRADWQRGGMLAIGLLIALTTTACQTGPVASADAGSASDLVTPTQAKPAVVYTLEAPEALPSFSLVDPEELAVTETATATTVVPAVATSTPPPSPQPTATATATLAPTETPTATPPPTFTPPALPFTLAEEHYWLRRPIADGGAVWTDKSYPYGHTRGGTLRPHHGVEFYVPRGTEVLAAASGTVRVAGNDTATAYGPQTNFYGNLVVIELDSRLNGRPVYNLYGHLSEIWVSEGQQVDTRQAIALSGASGVADGPHLHFEVRLDQNSYAHTRNPLLWLYPFPDRGTVAGRVAWSNGMPVHEAPVRLRRVDAPSQYAATTTYAAQGANPDDQWNENFALDDVEAGYYEVVVGGSSNKVVETVWVFPYRTSFVEIVLDAAGSQ